MKKIFRPRVMTCALLLAASKGALATCSFMDSRFGPNDSVALDWGTIVVQRDTPVGTIVARTSDSTLGGRNNFMQCHRLHHPVGGRAWVCSRYLRRTNALPVRRAWAGNPHCDIRCRLKRRALWHRPAAASDFKCLLFDRRELVATVRRHMGQPCPPPDKDCADNRFGTDDHRPDCSGAGGG